MSGARDSQLSEALARIVTDAALRDRFTTDPVSVTTLLELDDAASATLRALDAAQLARFADSLLRKRREEFLRVVPLTRRVCPSVGERYVDWLSVHAPSAVDSSLGPGEREALRALPALHAALRSDPCEVSYSADLLSWETLAAATRRDGVPRSFESRFALPEIVRDVQRGLLPTEAAPYGLCIRFDASGVHWSAQR